MENRRLFRSRELVVNSDQDVMLRPAQNHFDLIKRNIIDGVQSSTGLYDDVIGDVPEVFDPRVDKMELADSLIRNGMGLQKASAVASDGIQVEAES